MLSFVKRLREKAQYHKSLEASEGIIEYYKFDGFDEIAQCIEVGQPIEDIRGNYEAVKAMKNCNYKRGVIYAYEWFFNNLCNNISTCDNTENAKLAYSENDAQKMHCEINIAANVHFITTLETSNIFQKIVHTNDLKKKFFSLKDAALENWFGESPSTKQNIKAEKFALNRLLYV